MRDLASVVTIETKNKMFEKDRICVVTFKENGYEAIVPVIHNVGDKMVFIQEGSILPIEERWEFLRKRCFREDLNGFLIKPMTMGAKDANGQKGDKVKSWGLCVTLAEAGLPEDLNSGEDVTERLKIEKYEPDIEDASPRIGLPGRTPKYIKFLMKHRATRWLGRILLKKRTSDGGDFPSDVISKSDETTIQNCKELIERFPGTPAIITAKMEGQSFTCSLGIKKKKFYLCSRNSKLSKNGGTGDVFLATADRYDIEEKLKDYYKKTGDILCIQGEQVGPTIQNNIYNFPEARWFVFRVKCYHKKRWEEFTYKEFKPIMESMGLSVLLDGFVGGIAFVVVIRTKKDLVFLGRGSSGTLLDFLALVDEPCFASSVNRGKLMLGGIVKMVEDAFYIEIVASACGARLNDENQLAHMFSSPF